MIKKISSQFFIFFTVVLVLTVLMWNVFQDPEIDNSLTYIKKLVMNGARGINYKGVDKNGVEYTLHAEFLKELDNSHYELTNVKLDVVLKSGKTICITAKNVKFDNNNNIAYMKEDVFMKNSDGITLKTPSAKALIDQGFIEGDDEVLSTRGDNTQVKAKGFKIDNVEGNIVYKNHPTFSYETQ